MWECQKLQQWCGDWTQIKLRRNKMRTRGAAWHHNTRDRVYMHQCVIGRGHLLCKDSNSENQIGDCFKRSQEIFNLIVRGSKAIIGEAVRNKTVACPDLYFWQVCRLFVQRWRWMFSPLVIPSPSTLNLSLLWRRQWSCLWISLMTPARTSRRSKTSARG